MKASDVAVGMKVKIAAPDVMRYGHECVVSVEPGARHGNACKVVFSDGVSVIVLPYEIKPAGNAPASYRGAVSREFDRRSGH